MAQAFLALFQAADDFYTVNSMDESRFKPENRRPRVLIFQLNSGKNPEFKRVPQKTTTARAC
jgi:hypothetical protein